MGPQIYFNSMQAVYGRIQLQASDTPHMSTSHLIISFSLLRSGSSLTSTLQ